MNKEEFENWQIGVKEHLFNLNTLIEERVLLKKYLENHLQQFFDFEEIEYDKDFKKIKLMWSEKSSPIINHKNIGNLMMDWIIKSGYNDKADKVIIVEVYPFGVVE